VADIGVHDDLELSNYLFVPGEQADMATRTFVIRQ
jgi:hypothetical protein